MARPISLSTSGRSPPNGPDLFPASLTDFHTSTTCPRLLARTTMLVPRSFFGHARSFVLSILILFVVCVCVSSRDGSLVHMTNLDKLLASSDTGL